MGIVKEFKEFIIKGNMVDMAVGIIIGAAFGLVVKSFVADIIMPPIGAAMGGIDFAELKYELVPALEAGTDADGNPVTHPVTQLEIKKDIPAVTLNYGLFINACIALLIQGFAIFILIKFINAMKRKEEETPKEAPKPSQDIVLLGEIRDLLAERPPNG
ncbi:MAG: large-conductance mechanosensitive channel protein MscL [Planctomycetota bacterium]